MTGHDHSNYSPHPCCPPPPSASPTLSNPVKQFRFCGAVVCIKRACPSWGPDTSVLVTDLSLVTERSSVIRSDKVSKGSSRNTPSFTDTAHTNPSHATPRRTSRKHLVIGHRGCDHKPLFMFLVLNFDLLYCQGSGQRSFH